MGISQTENYVGAMREETEEQKKPLLLDQPPESNVKRTGTTWTAVAHIITGVIGSGVLSLAWSMAQLGWIAGPLVMLIFAGVTLLSTFLLSNCYRSPDPEYGPIRNHSYIEAVDTRLGRKKGWVCALFVQVYLYGMGIAYTITSAISMRAIQKSNCYHKEGHEALCEYEDTSYMLLFGAVQVILSQIPDFHNMHWLSIVAAIMSFTYAFIGLGLGFAQVIENGYVKGNITGVRASSAAKKIWIISQALGDIAFAYPYNVVLIEIEDTLKSPPPENWTMKKASTIAILVTIFFYLCCGGLGYAAFGEYTPGNLLTGFGFYEPYWLIDVANAGIILHLCGGYQVFSQPLFANFEKWFAEKYPNSRLLKNKFVFRLPFLPTFELNFLRLWFRTTYVVSTLAIAMIFPYFNEVIGVIGGLNFWPLTIYFPVEMYLEQNEIEAWTIKWIMLRAFNTVCFFVTVFALTGSIEGLVSAKLS